jgi:hypothetical protein
LPLLLLLPLTLPLLSGTVIPMVASFSSPSESAMGDAREPSPAVAPFALLAAREGPARMALAGSASGKRDLRVDFGFRVIGLLDGT